MNRVFPTFPQGEQQAATQLEKAAQLMEKSKGAMQLRYFQTVNSIAAEKKSTV